MLGFAIAVLIPPLAAAWIFLRLSPIGAASASGRRFNAVTWALSALLVLSILAYFYVAARPTVDGAFWLPVATVLSSLSASLFLIGGAILRAFLFRKPA